MDDYGQAVALPGQIKATSTSATGRWLTLDGVTVADAILALQAMAGLHPAGIRSDYAVSGADVSHDGRIGMDEALYILQYMAEMQ